MEIPRIDYNRDVCSPDLTPDPTPDPPAAPSPVLACSPSPIPDPPAVSEPPALLVRSLFQLPKPLPCLFRGTIPPSPQITLRRPLMCSPNVIALPSHLLIIHPFLHITLPLLLSSVLPPQNAYLGAPLYDAHVSLEVLLETRKN